MKYPFLFCLFISLQQFCYGQHWEQHDLKSKKLYGKVKTVKTCYNSATDYFIDTFDNDGFLLKSWYIDSNGVSSASPTYFFHDKSGHSVMNTVANNEIIDTLSYTYNDKGQLKDQTRQTIYIDIDTSNNGLINIKKIKTSNKIELLYDDKDEWIGERWENIDHNGRKDITIQHFSYKKNGKNQLIEIITDTLLPENDLHSTPIFYKSYEYFEMGYEHRFRGKAILKYDTENRVIGQDLYGYDGKLKGKVVCTRDKYDNIVSTTVSYYRDTPSTLTDKYKYQYDKYNNWVVKQTIHIPCQGWDRGDDYSFKRTIEYY